MRHARLAVILLLATTAQRLTYLAATHARQLNAAALASYRDEFHDAGCAASSIPSFRMNSYRDRQSTSSRDCIRTASEQTDARSRRGSVPKGSLLSPPADSTRAYGPLRRLYS